MSLVDVSIEKLRKASQKEHHGKAILMIPAPVRAHRGSTQPTALQKVVTWQMPEYKRGPLRQPVLKPISEFQMAWCGNLCKAIE